ncbi:MAG: phosphate acyltransferase PlsX [Planctomycetota bacterium]|nr:MAG: phosphate acyltransferase PlsX [Planctomycetota bacterium]
MRLAVDVMGGDHAPEAVLEGCALAAPHLEAADEIVLVGPEDVVRPWIERQGGEGCFTCEPASERIQMHESPARAVRQKPDSSIVKMCLLASRKAAHPVDAALSAGNTGACVAAATMYMKRLTGAHRPGIAVTIPTFSGPVVMCDVGANPEPKLSHLAQYAVMAEVYAKHVHAVERPRVALLNIGEEEAKGTKAIKQVHETLKAASSVNYIGFIEARDIFDGAADVVVTDGFVGNSLLKLSEGLARALFRAFTQQVMEAAPELARSLGPVAAQMRSKVDYHEHGGAPLLGVNGVCMICHGSAEPRSIASAIRQTKAFVQTGVNQAIVERLAELAPVIEKHTPASLAAGAER